MKFWQNGKLENTYILEGSGFAITEVKEYMDGQKISYTETTRNDKTHVITVTCSEAQAKKIDKFNKFH